MTDALASAAAAMDLMLQFQATNSRLPVMRSRSLEARARGAATVAALEIGLFASLEELAHRWGYDRRFEPQVPFFIDLGYQA